MLSKWFLMAEVLPPMYFKLISQCLHLVNVLHDNTTKWSQTGDRFDLFMLLALAVAMFSLFIISIKLTRYEYFVPK